MQYTSPIVLSALALTLVVPACSNEKCGTSDRGCVDDTESASATDVTASGSTGSTGDTPTTTAATDPTTGTPGELMRCKPTCTVDSDCTLDGMDIGFTCVDGECGVPSCTSDEACQQLFSGWSEPCMATAECFMGEVCIDIGGGDGRCALHALEFHCEQFGLVEVMKPAIAGGDVTVCADIDATCKDDACTSPCKSDDDCPAEQGRPHCSPDGECRCSSDAECQATMQPGFSVCMENGRCGCSSDADCAGGTNVDTCVAGSCGCSSNAACTDPVFDNVTQVCEAA